MHNSTLCPSLLTYSWPIGLTVTTNKNIVSETLLLSVLRSYFKMHMEQFSCGEVVLCRNLDFLFCIPKNVGDLCHVWFLAPRVFTVAKFIKFNKDGPRQARFVRAGRSRCISRKWPLLHDQDQKAVSESANSKEIQPSSAWVLDSSTLARNLCR